MLDLIGRLVDAGGAVYDSALARRVLGEPTPGCGMPIGSFFSQWAGALYLDGLDHFVKRSLKVRGYLRYMDDASLFADDAGRLVEAREAIADWLLRERGLQLNPRRGAVVPAAEPSVFLGYRVSRAGVSPGPKLRRRLRRNVARAARRGPTALARCLAAYRGIFLF